MTALDELMNEMPKEWRDYWCSSQTCACMGGTNCSGGLAAKGFTREDWEQWMAANNITPRQCLDLGSHLEFVKQLQELRTTKEKTSKERLVLRPKRES